MDDLLDILGVFGVHPQVDLLMGQDDRHSVVNVRKLRSGILSEYDYLVVICVESCH